MPPRTKKAKAVKKAVIKISTTDLAAIANMDHYNNFAKVVCKIWKQLDKASFEAYRARNAISGNFCALDSYFDKIKHLEDKSGTRIGLLKRVSEVNKNKEKTSHTLVENQQQMATDINQQLTNLSSHEKDMLNSLIASATNTRHGVYNENNGVKIFENETGKKVIASQKMSLLPVFEDEKFVWKVVGKFDGLTESNELVEIKNRQRCLFNTIRDYEMCQLQVYMKMHSCQEGYLVECYKNQQNNMEFNILDVQFNSEYFDNVLQNWISRFINFMYELVFGQHQHLTEEVKICLISGDNKKQCYPIYKLF
jgi:hypothetical protein